jgi:Lon-like protease
MTQRTLAGLVAVPLLVALWVAALLVPLPYVVYSPGYTIDVLGKTKGTETIDVEGAPSYHDDGQLRFTTVFVTQPDTHIGLLQAMGAWIDPDAAVYPYDTVYAPGETDATSRREGEAQMSSSQDTAVAVALTELGRDFETEVVVGAVQPGSPSEGVLREGDQLLAVGGDRISSPNQVASAVEDDTDGRPLEIRVLRGGAEQSVSVQPEDTSDGPRIGVQLGLSYDFPFEVDFGIDPNIGGPSAGLMLSLAVYDVLTEGSLTGGDVVAGTGELLPNGAVGPIGGIDQKIAAARDDGASLFMVPPDNCEDAIDAPRGDMRLVRADTMSDALAAIKTWAGDHDADLPACPDDPGSSGA